MKNHLLLNASLIILAATLTGCAGTPHHPTPEPDPDRDMPLCRENIGGVIVEREPPCREDEQGE
ncbi:hypothetical protein [Wenzhouxiangella sp. EGI_FJ10305]|uniref:hypothetical protein n=1 Tax=Wenzhouxiangella sp. EGI_FJ10305 TaxID=3243768 RepID=UPI0035DA5B2C